MAIKPGGIDEARRVYIERRLYRDTDWSKRIITKETKTGLSYKVADCDIRSCCVGREFNTLGALLGHTMSHTHVARLYGVDPEEVLAADAAIAMIRRLQDEESGKS